MSHDTPAYRPRLVLGITGATGAIYALRFLQVLRSLNTHELHVVVSQAGWLNLKYELNLERADIARLADTLYPIKDIGAAIASGSFQTVGMIVAPCSMRTLAAVAHGLSDNLISRSADVVLKERKRLVMMVRETPFNLAHLRNMTAVTEMGGIIYPPLPAFYQHPQSIAEMVDHTVARVLHYFDINEPAMPEWQGLNFAQP